MVAAVASGRTCRSVAEMFRVSVASVVKWSQRQRARAVRRPRGWAGAAAAAEARAGLGFGADRREAGSDAAGAGGGAGRARHAVELRRGVALLPARRHHVQKKPCTPASRTGRRRPPADRWKTHQAGLIPRRLVFIDETWAKTNMTRRHGRCAAARGWSPRCRTAAGAP